METRGGRKTSRMTPLPKRDLDPPSYGTFSTPLRCQCAVFPVQKSTTEQIRSSFGGVQKFSGERILWYIFLTPYVPHPPVSRPTLPPWHVFRQAPKAGGNGIRIHVVQCHGSKVMLGVFCPHVALHTRCLWSVLSVERLVFEPFPLQRDPP